MFRLFRARAKPEDLAVSIVAVRLGDRLLQIGCEHPRLLAALAGKVGLTGRACAVDQRTAAADRARSTAAAAGVLVEIEVQPVSRLPYNSEAFDIVVASELGRLSPEERAGCLREAFRVLRPAGRCIVVDRAARGGLGRLLGTTTADSRYRSSGGALTALRAEGFVAARRLAERQGLAYYEAAKPRGTARDSES